MADLIVKNASIIDGTGSPAFPADLAVTGDRISHVAPSLSLDARETIQGQGLVLCPGFIDMHTHSDFTLLLSPGAESKITQGVTTEVTGNCGGSPAPVPDEFRNEFMEYMSDLGKHYKRELGEQAWQWKTLDDFLLRIEEKGSALNLVPLVGHSTLRANAMGYASRPPSPDEMTLMTRLLRDEMENGAFGLSSGLIYHPGAFARKEELAGLARSLPRYNGIYATHMRSEGIHLFDAVDEAISVARDSGVSLEISHLKCESPSMWGKGKRLLDKIDRAREEGIDVHFDQYPYTAYGTGLIEFFPPWAKGKGATTLKQLLSDPGTRQKIITSMTCPEEPWENPMEGLGWEDIRLTGFAREENRPFNGETAAALAAAKGMAPIDAVIDVFLREKEGLGMIVFAMSENDLETIMKHPLGMIGSDGCSVAPDGPTGRFPVHPRFYGTFPRVLARYAREKKTISLEKAVRKMTGLPAQKLGLQKRGIIKEGMAADIVLFDPLSVQDRADFTSPHEYAAGIPFVFVNGQAVVKNGKTTGKRPGKRLYNYRY